MLESDAHRWAGESDVPAAAAFAECLVRRGYRRRPPRPLLAETGGTTLFTSVASPDWRRSLTGYPRPEPGGAAVLQWILNTSRLMTPPSASPPSAGRAVGAVWTGLRPYDAALRDSWEALRQAGIAPAELRFLLSSEPRDSSRVVNALLDLGVDHGRITLGTRLPETPPRMDPELGPCLTLRRTVRSSLFAHCDARCTCGCHVSVAHIQFVERRRTSGRLAAVTQPLFEMIVFEHTLTHVARPPSSEPDGTGSAVPLLLAPLSTAISDLLAGRTAPPGPNPVLLADVSSSASLLLGEGVAPGPRGGPYVLRRLIRMIGTELALHGLPPALLTSVLATAETAYRSPHGFPRLPARSWEHVADELKAFSRVLSKGRSHVRRPGVLSDQPYEMARQLIRLRSEKGVPLGLSLRWCREEGMELAHVHLALADLSRTESPVPRPGASG
ncbi:hypothetical protein [Streptomyces sp. NPDC001083]|uniref:hypothetical protein n=1 Tax=Streptomyces sp. NPDC001083 TaxID=3364545 RepID=UPI0036C47942